MAPRRVWIIAYFVTGPATIDDDIRARHAAGDYHGAFESLVERYKEKVFRLALTMLRDAAHAEDSTQDVFVRIWKALPNYHGGASLSTWIYTITRNACLTELAKRSARPTVSLSSPELEPILDSLAPLCAHDQEAGVEMDALSALARLPEKYRQVITLFYLEQRSYEETAQMLGLPLGTVKTNLFRAKKELLALVKERATAGFRPLTPLQTNAKPARGSGATPAGLAAIAFSGLTQI